MIWDDYSFSSGTNKITTVLGRYENMYHCNLREDQYNCFINSQKVKKQVEKKMNKELNLQGCYLEWV